MDSISFVRSNCFQSQSRDERNIRVYLFLIILFVEHTRGWKSLFMVSELNRSYFKFISVVIISAIRIIRRSVLQMEPMQILWLNVQRKMIHFVSFTHRNEDNSIARVFPRVIESEIQPHRDDAPQFTLVWIAIRLNISFKTRLPNPNIFWNYLIISDYVVRALRILLNDEVQNHDDLSL